MSGKKGQEERKEHKMEVCACKGINKLYTHLNTATVEKRVRQGMCVFGGGGGGEHGCRDKELQQLGEEGVGTGVGGWVLQSVLVGGISGLWQLQHRVMV